MENGIATALPTLNLDTDVMISNIPTFTSDWTGLIQKTGAIKAVSSAEERQGAIDAMNTVKAMGKSAEEHYDPLAKALNTVKMEVTGRRGAVVDACKAEALRLGNLALEYDREQERQRRAEEERIRREQEERAAAERKRLEDEASAKAADLEAQGDFEQAAKVVQDAIAEAAMPALTPEIILPDHRPKASVAGASTVIQWGQDVQVVDFKALIEAAYKNPDAFGVYLMPNESALKAHAKAIKENFKIPGCVSRPKEALRSYSRA